jgi:hypothetical protein
MMKVRLFAAACLLAQPWTLHSQSTVPLDKLADCKGLEQSVAVLRTSPSRRCRDAGGPIESRLISQFRMGPSTQICLLIDPPPQLSGFTCVRTSGSNAAGLTCFRAIDRSALDDYKKRFAPVYSDKVARYEKSAKACSVGNGHFAVVESELYPPQFASIAKPRFGFAIGIDTNSTMRGEAYHGFADVDPVLTPAPKAIEIFDVFQTDQIVLPEPDVSTESANVFEIKTENMDAAGRAAAAWLQSQTHNPSVGKVRLFTLKYKGKKDVEFSKRQSDLEEWQDGIISVLKDAGFRDFNEDDGPPPNFDSMREMLIRNSPIANRKFNDDSVGPRVVGLTTDNKRCLEFATVFVLEPVEDVKSDYGGFFVQIAGTGDCRKSQGSSGVLSEGRFDDIIEYLKGTL